MTTKQLRNTYKRYNKKYFNNKLDKHLLVTHASSKHPLPKTILGGAFWRDNRKAYYKIVIERHVGSVIDKMTLLHEMIHIKLGKANHGSKFLKEIKRLFRAGAYDRLL